jgi:hypothetical protein
MNVKRTSVPIGAEWLRAMQTIFLERCCSATDAFIARDEDLSARVSSFGTVLSLLDQLSACAWGCSHHDHTVHYVIGRACQSASAAWILIRHGHYDASLSLTRGVAEIANLVALLAADEKIKEQWLASAPEDKTFGPVKVRLELESRGLSVPASQHLYKALSERAAHATPRTRPEVYSATDRPLASGTFQEDGVHTSLSSLSFALGRLAVDAVRMLTAPEEHLKEIASAGRILIQCAVEGEQPGTSFTGVRGHR